MLLMSSLLIIASEKSDQILDSFSHLLRSFNLLAFIKCVLGGAFGYSTSSDSSGESYLSAYSISFITSQKCIADVLI